MKTNCPKCGSEKTASHFSEDRVYKCNECGRLFEASTLADKILYYVIAGACLILTVDYLIRNY